MIITKYIVNCWHRLLKNSTYTAIASLYLFGQTPIFSPKSYSDFSDWCLNYSQLSPDTKNTVEALVAKALANYDSDRIWQQVVNTDKCTEVEKVLIKQESISFEPDDSISDLSPLTSLRNLKELNLQGQSIEDLSPLSALKQLEKLNLSRNLIRDTTPLSSLKLLKKLDLSYNLIYYIEPLSSLTKLEDLNIGRASISNVEALNPLINLKLLNLANNQINNVEPLSSLYNLNKLDLSFNVIKDVSPLASLDNIVELKVESNFIPPEAQICPVDELIACNDLYNQRIADYSVEKIDIFQRPRQILERNRRLLRKLR